MNKESVSVALGRFQGIAVGMAFLVGIPLGAVLGSKYSLKTTLYLAVALCAINALLIAFCLPERNVIEAVSIESNTNHTSTATNNNGISLYVDNFRRKLRRVKWANASPLGALRLMARKRRLIAGSWAYFFLNVAQVRAGIGIGAGIGVEAGVGIGAGAGVGVGVDRITFFPSL